MATIALLPVDALQVQLDALTARCAQIDNTLKQTENRCFVFEVHQFAQRSLNLMGYALQVKKTLNAVRQAVQKNRPELLIKIECDQFINQFQLLLQLVQSIESGKEALLYKSYSLPKEKLYQQLQKQSEYEHRLLAMIAEQEELLASAAVQSRSYIKEKIEALKIRFEKCNSYTQKIEFQLEELNDEG